MRGGRYDRNRGIQGRRVAFPAWETLAKRSQFRDFATFSREARHGGSRAGEITAFAIGCNYLPPPYPVFPGEGYVLCVYGIESASNQYLWRRGRRLAAGRVRVGESEGGSSPSPGVATRKQSTHPKYQAMRSWRVGALSACQL